MHLVAALRLKAIRATEVCLQLNLILKLIRQDTRHMRQILENPFESFWMAGFECSDQLNTHGDRVDFIHITSHLDLIEQDYRSLGELNIKTVREGVRWSQVEFAPYQYDFTILGQMIRVGKMMGIQQIWDLCHFGFPGDLTPLHPHFPQRFKSFCKAFAQFYRKLDPEGTLVVTPINEVGFISWLGGDVAGTSPFCFNNGWKVKYAYVKAYIEGIKALKEIDSSIRILTTEPLVNVTCRVNATVAEKEHAAFHHQLQFQVLDMLSGRICPELGGRLEYLDIVGFNYYYNNQWILDPHRVIGWNDPVPDPDYKSLFKLVSELYDRYNRPLVLSETSHPGIDRPLWVRHISEEIKTLNAFQVPIWGICWYPIIDRPDWDYTDQWHKAGIWDWAENAPGQYRILHQPTMDALKEAQRVLASCFDSSDVGRF